MKGKLFLLVATIFELCIVVPVKAQQSSVGGRVIDAQSGKTLPGVNVIVKGTSTGTATDANGEYELQVESLQDTLEFSFVGYQTLEKPINGRTVVDVDLIPKAVIGDELVVVGYGTVQKSDLTGSVSSIREEDFAQGVATSVDQLIGNKVAGVRFVQSSNLPGSGIEINIRGSGSINAGTGPLYVVDGLPIDNSPATQGTGAGFTNSRFDRNPLNAINPNDIESIEILKDASATAIYGSRGANGVVLITTKGGRGGDIEINYDGYTGIQAVGNRLDILDAQEFQQVINGIIDDGGGQPEDRVEQIANNGAGTDWQDLTFRDAAMINNHNFSFSGGANTARYFASVNFFGQEGIVKNSAMQRYTGRLNLDFQPNEKLNAGLKLSTAYIRDDYVMQGFQINRSGGVIQSAYKFDPTLPARDENGELTQSQEILMENPLALFEGTESFANTYRAYGIIFGEYSILPQLSVKVNVGGDFTSRRRDSYNGAPTFIGSANNGIATIMNGTKSNYLAEGTVNFVEDYGIHSINAIAGVTFQRFLTDRSSISIQDFPSDQTKTFNVGLGNPNFDNVGSTRFSNELTSYIGRVNYTLRDKYLVTATLRADGSSRFAKGKRFGYFPSGALGWRLDQEPFMESLEFISTLKPRISWGQTGNQEIGNLQFTTTFGSGPTAIIDGNEVSTIEPTRLGNPNLQWEVTEQWDIGLDFGLWEERVTGSIDYFNKVTEDMLIALPVPTSTGFSTRLSNVGSIKNTGFEVAVNSRNISGRDFQWSTDLSFSTLSNEVQDLGGISEIITGGAGRVQQIGIIREGAPLFSFFGWKVEGVWQQDDDFSVTDDPVQPGDLKYRDVNDDGRINADDRMILGNSFPDFTWTIGNTFSYKNFDMSILVEGVEGIEMLNVNLADSYYPTALRRNKIAEPYLNRWTPDNPSNRYPSFVNPNVIGVRAVNSRTVEDASYIRLKTVRLSYNIPPYILGNYARSVSIYVTGENLVTITDYMGTDPAVNPNSNANFRIDWNSAPLVTTYMLGVRLGF